MTKQLDYKKSGVDIHKADFLKKAISRRARGSSRAEVLQEIGGFGGLFHFQKQRYHDPILVSSADGVGTKLKIALLLGRHTTVGIDVVAMNVNDILCTGAEPLFFLDYLSYSNVENAVLLHVVEGVNKGCREAGCALIGGETAQMPGMYKKGEYDLAGFCVGVVEKKELIDGSRIVPGDSIIGLESSGIHSNGYALVRKSLSQKEQRNLGRELLKPTRLYVQPVLTLLRSLGRSRAHVVKGIAHITGGAFYSKISRILPSGVDARIVKHSWSVPRIFRYVQNRGGIADEQMYRTFNMGIGMVFIVSPEQVGFVLSRLNSAQQKAFRIGEITKGSRRVSLQ